MLNLAVRNALVLTPVVFGLRACGQDEREKAAGSLYAEKAGRAVREYVFAIHPLHNPLCLFKIYDPLIDYLKRNIPAGSLAQLRGVREKAVCAAIQFCLAQSFLHGSILRKHRHGTA